MKVTGALREIRRELIRSAAWQRSTGLLPITEDDSRSWWDWQVELDTRVNQIAAQTAARGRPDVRMVVALAAQCVGLLMALDRAETLDVTSGDEQVAA